MVVYLHSAFNPNLNAVKYVSIFKLLDITSVIIEPKLKYEK